VSKNKTKKFNEEKVIESVVRTAPDNPLAVRFSPPAWAKLCYLRDIGDTEIGGFAVTHPDDLLYVMDFQLVKQECSMVKVDFDDDAIADYTMDMVESGYSPEQFMRIWVHTHPNMSAHPSGTDLHTFKKVFGKCDWSVMVIVSNTGDQFCRLRINTGPFPGLFDIPMYVDYTSYEFDGSDTASWLKEYEEKVTEKKFHVYKSKKTKESTSWKNQQFSKGYFGGEINKFDDDLWLNEADGWVYDENLHSYSRKAWWDDVDEIEDDEDFLDIDIPDELVSLLTPNELVILENMEDDNEREFHIAELKSKYKII